ncbi:unnamed protein product, partial [Rotaria magnacalcarata]
MRFDKLFIKKQEKTLIILFQQPTDEINQQPLTTSIPLKLNTSFSTPNNFTSLRRDSPLIKA